MDETKYSPRDQTINKKNNTKNNQMSISIVFHYLYILLHGDWWNL